MIASQRRLSAVYDVVRALAADVRLDRAIGQALAVLARALMVHRALVVFEGGAGLDVAAWTLEGDDPARREAADGQARATFAYLAGRAESTVTLEARRDDGQRIVLPLVAQRRVVGAILLVGVGLGEDDLELVSAVAQHLALVVGQRSPGGGSSPAPELHGDSPIGQVTLSAAGEVLDLNAAAAALLGVERRRARAPLHDHLADEDAVALEAHLRTVAASSAGDCLDVEVTPRARRDRRLLLVSRREVVQGSPTCVTALLDVTARARLQVELELLAEAGLDLATLDPATVLARLCRLPVPRFADLAVVDVVDGARLVPRASLAHADLERGRRFAACEERWQVAPNVAFAELEALRTGCVVRVPDVSARYMMISAVDPDHLAAVVGLALRSWLAVPLLDVGDGQRRLAVLRLATAGTRRPFDARDEVTAGRLGALAGRALSNAREHARAVKGGGRA